MGDHVCGGTVVAPDIILSAGHCLPFSYRIVVGVYNFSDTLEIVEKFVIVEKLRHPKYDDTTLQFDLALFKIDGNITLTDLVKINEDPKVPFFGEKLTVVGWGTTEYSLISRVIQDVMHEVEVQYVGNTRCKQIPDEFGVTMGDKIFDDMMCAGGEGMDACSGDSGGPLLLGDDDPSETLQVGVTSWGTDCGTSHPGVYQRTSFSFQWIKKSICRYSKAPPDYLLCNAEPPTSTPAPSESPTQAPTVAPMSTPPLSSTASPGVAISRVGIVIIMLRLVLV
jgi:trypsin